MSDTLASLRRKISGAGDLESVVRSMKALAAASIGQYERSVLALDGYYRTVELGLVACLSNQGIDAVDRRSSNPVSPKTLNAIVFGSDQGLVGQFNDVLANFVATTLAGVSAEKKVWAVGERIHARLKDVGFAPTGLYRVPNSIHAITPLIGRILVETNSHDDTVAIDELILFHNAPQSGASYQPTSQQLLPLDSQWSRRLVKLPWPTKSLPQVIGPQGPTLSALVREYLFVSLFKACAESLASENASRLAAMQRAEKNIGEIIDRLNQTFRRLRQASIDEELFDVVSGYESLAKVTRH
ncbi:MAG: F0F1 ATP synthase subunit gamma [Planctomycetales bacterium]|nr:F0F1 ATP synthase subunit gamma [Planctomycetales bacterium]